MFISILQRWWLIYFLNSLTLIKYNSWQNSVILIFWWFGAFIILTISYICLCSFHIRILNSIWTSRRENRRNQSGEKTNSCRWSSDMNVMHEWPIEAFYEFFNVFTVHIRKKCWKNVNISINRLHFLCAERMVISVNSLTISETMANFGTNEVFHNFSSTLVRRTRYRSVCSAIFCFIESFDCRCCEFYAQSK